MEEFSINEKIEQAETLPSWAYHSDEFYACSKANIFEKTWHYITEVDNVEMEGDIFPFTLGKGCINEPLMLTKDHEKTRCLSNVCTHRGNILVEHPCRQKRIVCCYHGRKFDLNGCFKHMPEFKEAEDFPTERDNLTELKLETMFGFYFTALHPRFDFKDAFGDIEKRVSFLPLNEMRIIENYSREYLVNCSWMLYCENYLEGFHIPFIHSGLAQALDYGSYDYEIGEYYNLQIGYVKSGDEQFNIPEGHRDYGKNIGAYYYWLFPNIMFNFYPWGMSLNLINPLAPQKTKVIFKTYIWDESKYNLGAGSDLDKVEREDEEIVERVQRGMNSRLYKRGRFSPKMEKGVHHFHGLIADFTAENS